MIYNLSIAQVSGVAVAAVASVLLLLDFSWNRPRPMFKRPPAVPIAGHLGLFSPSVFLTYMLEKVRQYGPFVQMNVFGETFLIVSDAETVKEALSKRPKTFRRPRLFEAPFDSLGLWPHSLFIAEGAVWNRLRKATAAPFNKQNVGGMGPSVAAEIANSMTRIESMAGKVLDVGEEMMRLTLRIIIRVALGDVSMLADYFQDNSLYIDSKKVFEYLIERTLFPLGPFFWKLFYARLESDALTSYSNITGVVTRIVEMERENSKKSIGNDGDASAGPRSYIQILLKECSNDEADISNAEIVSNVTTLLLAGSETTSVSVTWAMYYLAQNTELLQQARDEAAAYFNSSGKDLASVDFAEFLLGEVRNKGNTLKRFPFCAACFKEVVRMSGPAAFVGLQLVDNTKPVQLATGVTMQPGDTMFCYAEAIQMNESAFPEPHVFNPRRWLDATPDQLEIMSAHYFAFGSGPRACPGMGLAYFEGELILAALVTCFDVELACDPREVKRILSFTAQADRVPIKFTRRK